jgi:tetratricopeptide (TPR) repeat protein
LALFWRPEKVSVLQVTSDCYSLCGETAKAVQLLDRILEAKPDDAIAWVKKGNAMNALGKHEDAIVCYDKAIANAPRTMEVWKFRGGSTKEIVGAIPADMVEAKAWNGRGLALKALGKHVEAVASYEAARKIDPKKSDVWCNKGNAFHAANRHMDALQCFDKAVALDSRDMKSWCNRGASLKALGRLDEAVKSYDKALALDPRDVKTWFNKANALAAQEKYQEAMVCFQEAQDLGDPNAGRYVEQCRRLLQPDADGPVTTATSANDAQELYDKAADLASTGRHAEAVACYESGLRLDPRNPHIWFNMAHSIGHLGRHQDVVKCCERALKIHPNFSPLWILKGLGFLSMEQFHESIDCFQESEKLGDTSARGHMARCRIAQAEWYFRLGSRYQQEGNHTQANACYEKGLALDPSKAAIWVNKGAALLALKRASEAVACFNRAITLDPRDFSAWNNKGIALMSLGQHSDALACIKEAKRLRA